MKTHHTGNVRRQARWLSAAAVVVLFAPASAWAQDGMRVWLPQAVTTTAPVIDRLFYIVLAITGAVFIGVQLTLVYFLIRYRRRPGVRAGYTHGNNLVEVVWTAIPAIILVWLSLRSQQVWSQVRGTPPPPDLEVAITAQQFAWNIHYPGADRRFGRTEASMVDEASNPIGLDRTDPSAQDDLVSVNQLHLPLNQTVLIHLKAKDVIHSFFVPQFRLKQDAVPGITSRMWVQPTTAGNFDIACAELCGLGHYRMRGFLTIESPEEFQNWLTQSLAEQAL